MGTTTEETPMQQEMNDLISEWRLLSSFVQSPETMHQVTPALFTDEREIVFNALKTAYIHYGELSYEVMRLAFNGDTPSELIPVQCNQRALVDELSITARRRQLLRAAEVLASEAKEYNPNESRISEVLNFAPIMPSSDVSLLPGAQKLMSDLHRKYNGTYTFTHTGVRFLDQMLGGEWLPKSLSVLMAKPGTGKTALVGQSMLEMALQYNTRSLFFSLEMSKEQLMSRWVSYMLGIDTTLLQFGKLSAAQMHSVEDAIIKLQTLPMSVIDNPVISLASIRKEIRDAARTGCRVVFLDYLQIVKHHNTGLKNYDLGEVAQGLKEAAKESDLAVVLLSQMNKVGEGLDAVRDSGEVSQVADTVIEMSPIDDYPDELGNRAIGLRFHKNRNGRLGTSTVMFNGSTQKFSY
jgi:replicative DNA helicase